MTNTMASLMGKTYKIRNPLLRQCLAELLGTFMLIVLGNAAVAQAVLTNFVTNPYFNIVWGYALGVAFGALIAGGVSGAHLNPAISFAFAVFGKFSWLKVVPYIIAQNIGAFLASAVIYTVYYDALVAFEDTPSQLTAGIWATYPGSIINTNGTVIPHLTLKGGFIDQVCGTSILLICICGITDQKNSKLPSWISSLFVGFVIIVIGLTYGLNCGFAINPARDLAPRLFTYIAGWGDIPFTATTIDGYVWWWVPIAGPHIGAILGIFIYTFFIEMHHPEDKKEITQCTKEQMSRGCC